MLGANFGKDRQKDGVDLNKLLKATPEDVRRSPIKISLTDAENLNEVKQTKHHCYVIVTGCQHSVF